jgi:hypothetical protein
MLGLGDGGAAEGATGAAGWEPRRTCESRILPTEAVSRQVAPGQAGDRAARDSCSAGDQVFIAAVLQRAQFKAVQGPEGPKVAHDDPEHVGPRRVHESQGAALFLPGVRKSCSGARNPAAACEPVARAG